METPKILKVLNKGVILAVAVSLLSFIFPLLPCKTSAVVAHPVYSWGMCKLPNPFGEPLVGLSTKYLAVYTEPLAGLAAEFLIVFVLSIVIFMLLKRKATKILDLTHKR
jgi:hypothetical protein